MDKVYFYHGTSAVYINYIIKNGINGKYPDELFDLLVKYYDGKSISGKKIYIDRFIHRQEDIRTNKDKIYLSLTRNLSVAEEFANRERINGEGPGVMINRIYERYENGEFNKLNLEEKNKIYNLLKFFGKYSDKQVPGLILAFTKIDLEDIIIQNENYMMESELHMMESELHMLENIKSHDYELVYRHQISPINIYIYDSSTKIYIKLLSDEANEYIQKINLSSITNDYRLTKLDADLIIPEDMLNREITLNNSEIIKYKIRYVGESDLYKNYKFDIINSNNSNYTLIIKKKLISFNLVHNDFYKLNFRPNL